MFSTLSELVNILTGHLSRGDIAQDFYGFRALTLGLDPYPALGPAFASMGIFWPITHASTHPPTAYLLTAPVAFLSWPIASAIWAWLMIIVVVVSLRLYGFGWRWIALIIPLFCFFPPFVYSLGQITPLWLLGTALAYHNKERPMAAGAWIAFASLTKFMPGLLLLPFLFRRKWSVLVGFISVWLFASVLIIAIHPGAISRYIEVNQGNLIEMIMRVDNGAFLPVWFKLFGWIGVVMGIVFIALVGWAGRRNLHLWEFLAVTLLPIAWTYSLLPLVPGLIKNWKSPILPIIYIMIVFAPSFGPVSAFYIWLTFILVSLSMMIPSLPMVSNRLRHFIPQR